MAAALATYASTLAAFGAMGGLLLVQLLVVDVAGIKARHTPGTPVAADHALFLFRAVRAHANTNESIAIFILLALFGMFGGAAPGALGTLAWVYVGARLGHMLCYYAGAGIARSIAFAVSLLALGGMGVAGLLPWL